MLDLFHDSSFTVLPEGTCERLIEDLSNKSALDLQASGSEATNRPKLEELAVSAE